MSYTVCECGRSFQPQHTGDTRCPGCLSKRVVASSDNILREAKLMRQTLSVRVLLHGEEQEASPETARTATTPATGKCSTCALADRCVGHLRKRFDRGELVCPAYEPAATATPASSNSHQIAEPAPHKDGSPIEDKEAGDASNTGPATTTTPATTEPKEESLLMRLLAYEVEQEEASLAATTATPASQDEYCDDDDTRESLYPELEESLVPCPFCGGIPTIDRDGRDFHDDFPQGVKTHWGFFCKDHYWECDVDGYEGGPAVALWNRRHSQQVAPDVTITATTATPASSATNLADRDCIRCAVGLSVLDKPALAFCQLKAGTVPRESADTCKGFLSPPLTETKVIESATTTTPATTATPASTSATPAAPLPCVCGGQGVVRVYLSDGNWDEYRWFKCDCDEPGCDLHEEPYAFSVYCNGHGCPFEIGRQDTRAKVVSAWNRMQQGLALVQLAVVYQVSAVTQEVLSPVSKRPFGDGGQEWNRACRREEGAAKALLDAALGVRV